MGAPPDAAFGRGKVILLGEHIVVYGVEALAAGIDRGVHAWTTLADETSLACSPWGTTHAPDGDDDLSRALAAVLALGEGTPPRVRIDVEVALPAGAGLGCSAALGVAVVRALALARGEAPSDAEVAARALAWERVFHGNPSGVDNTMAAHGGVALFQKGAALTALRLRRPLPLVVGDSGEASSTKEMVAMVARQKERDPARFEQTCEAVRSLVRNARLAVEAGDLRALGQLMDLNQHLLSGLMLSTPRLEDMIAAAREAGALGAKLTGGGGGGCMIALAEDEASAARIREAVERAGEAAFVTEAR